MKRLLGIVLSTVIVLSIVSFTIPVSVAAITISSNLSEPDTTYDGFGYVINEDESCTITYYTGNLANVTIPSTIYGHKVKKIGSETFNRNESIKSVILPEGITQIAETSFANCENLKSISLPSTLKYIGIGAFAYCTNLDNIIVPDDVDYIGQYAFEDTKWLNKQQDGLIYLGKVCYKYKGEIPYGATVSIKAGTKCISGFAFWCCYGLKKVDIPFGVEVIGSKAFQSCPMLENIEIPDSVFCVGKSAFEGTKWFESQPDGLVYAGSNAYEYKGTMPDNTNITFRKGTKSITESLFYNQDSLTGVVIPDSVVSIGDYAFYSCSELGNISFGNGIETIGKESFSKCDNLKELVIPDSVQKIGVHCFEGCSNVENLKLSNHLTMVSEGTFLYCKKLKSVSIPNSIISIKHMAFSGCEGLNSISIGSKLRYIDTTFFEYCSSLSEISVSSENLFFASENGVLYNKNKSQIIMYPPNKSDDTYVVPDTVTIIGHNNYTYYNKIIGANLKTVIIPKNVKDIYEDSIGYKYNEEGKLVEVPDFTIKGYRGTVAESYANENHFSFVVIDKTLSTPSISKLENTSGGIKISWNKVSGAYGYRVYQKTSNGWKRIKDTTATSYTDSAVSVNQTKTYTMRCIDKNGNTVSGYNSKGWSKKYTPVAPIISKLENTSGGVKLSWNKVAGVYGYRLYYKTSSGGWKRFKDTTATSFIDSGVSPNRTETYTIRCIDKNGKTVSGFNSKGWSKKYTPVAPTISKLENTSGGIKLSWNKIAGVYGYRLYYKTSSGGWKRFKDTTATSFTDSGVSPNRTETYTIRCIDKNGKTVSGFYSKGWSKKYAPVAPKITKLTNTSKGVSVTWGKVAGVYGYRLYRKYAGGSWTKVKDTTSTSFTDSGAKKGKKVTYTLRCIDKNGKTISGYNATGWSITRK